MEARFKPLRGLFSRRGAQFNVPEYQRGFEWEKKHFEDLWADLQRIGERVDKHYLGNVILLGEEGDSRFEIVDGQQRMVTINILMMAIRDSENIKDPQDMRISDIINCYPTNEARRRLHLHEDKADQYFENLWKGDTEDVGGNIQTAYEYYSAQLANLNEGEIDELLSKIVEDLRVVETISQDTSLAYMIFQSQNERGLEVDPEVLIKARVYGDAERLDSKQDEMEVKGKWKQMYRRLNQELNSPRFGKAYRVRRPITQMLLNSEITTPTEIDRSSLYRTFDEVLQSYGDIQDLTDWFNETIDDYLNIASSDYDVQARGMTDGVRRNIQHLNSASSHAENLSLSILNNYEREDRVKEYFRLAATLPMRMVLAGYRSYERKVAVHTAAKEIRRGEDIREVLVNRISDDGPTNAEIEEHLKANNLTIRGQWRFRTLLILVGLEESRRGPLRMDLNNLHIEHIAPRNTFGEKGHSYTAWRRSLDENQFNDVRDRIGNLVLLQPDDHAKLDEESFSSKRNIYSNSDIKIAEDIAEYESWSEDQILDRSEYLAQELAKKWSV